MPITATPATLACPIPTTVEAVTPAKANTGIVHPAQISRKPSTPKAGPYPGFDVLASKGDNVAHAAPLSAANVSSTRECVLKPKQPPDVEKRLPDVNSDVNSKELKRLPDVAE